MTLRQAPRQCPVCSERLILTRLACEECGTELAGTFPTCEYCSLSSDDRETLRVFLASRGNMKELERHLGVSYPTARARFDGILRKLGIDGDDSSEDPPEVRPSVALLEELAQGKVDVDEALRRLRQSR